MYRRSTKKSRQANSEWVGTRGCAWCIFASMLSYFFSSRFGSCSHRNLWLHFAHGNVLFVRAFRTMLSHLKALASWLIPWCSLVIVPAHAFSDADHITRVDVYTDSHVFRQTPPINYFCRDGAERGGAHDVALLRVDVPSVGQHLHLAGAVAGRGFSVAPQAPAPGSMCRIIGHASPTWFQWRWRHELRDLIESTAALLGNAADGCFVREWAMEPGCPC
uniref:Uncharacterized protein n=1 Tax=Chlamydomonas chlamydogama TaxID=225041 RepID=A0A7S2VVS6_9CHLO|mmetsp:Transcript_287/g.569  ORF Transcript_287/g.569 Transcript_287/m.569 type:complete len:219 (+) Transcript_287:394-1050(+)